MHESLSLSFPIQLSETVVTLLLPRTANSDTVDLDIALEQYSTDCRILLKES
ncbi:hypothetical protein K439DRAFT_1632785, partial [Ramaria rubella]